MNDTMYINEKFVSISGEVGIIPQGELTSVIRLQGCNLSCGYCDAMDSQEINQENAENLYDVARWIRQKNYPVLITGGEPLVQFDSVMKLIGAIPKHVPVQIETNGTVRIGKIPDHVCIVMDYKLEHPPHYTECLLELKTTDYLKFVVSDVDELRTALFIINKLDKCKATIAISATDVKLYPIIVERIMYEKRRILVNIQLHKFIGVR